MIEVGANIRQAGDHVGCLRAEQPSCNEDIQKILCRVARRLDHDPALCDLVLHPGSHHVMQFAAAVFPQKHAQLFVRDGLHIEQTHFGSLLIVFFIALVNLEDRPQGFFESFGLSARRNIKKIGTVAYCEFSEELDFRRKQLVKRPLGNPGILGDQGHGRAVVGMLLERAEGDLDNARLQRRLVMDLLPSALPLFVTVILPAWAGTRLHNFCS